MTVYEVWKVPTEPIDDCPWAALGIFPRGSRLATCRTKERAHDIKSILESDAPHNPFGETMADRPFEFIVSEREFEEDLE